ncbi:MAG: SPFH/Band 7/PHB domain protein [SAR202 cluster bacterium]|nr:SPFH/Band 7/PHB domain protein [SAR202 cluster bacterium]|tara:strand:- start:30236 stop:31117 length:882 start_codon:yes stop_codon:yes gene_type:complete
MIPLIKVVKQYERLAVFTLGKFNERSGLRGPGLQILIWPFQTGTRIDLREEVINIPRQTNITRDNAPIDITFLVYLRPIESEAQKVVLEVINYHQAVIGMATTILRAVIGEMNVDDVLSQRERINQELRVKLDDITGRWGIRVSAVEIKEIEPAPDIQEAMNRQMSAERIRRADVTEAEGKRQAEIEIAEGDKQAEILRAEGHRQSEILTAEGDQQAAVLRADGFSIALDRIHQVASNVDTNTISLQYFETLKEMGKGSATKFVFPMEFTNLLGPFASMLSAKNSGANDEENN